MGKDDEAVAEYRRAIKLAPKGYYLEVELTDRIIDIYRKQAGTARAARAVREGLARGRARSLRVGHARPALRGDRRAGQGDRRAQEGGRQVGERARDPAPPDPAARELGPRRRGARAVRGGRARGAGRGAVPARARRALLAPRRRRRRRSTRSRTSSSGSRTTPACCRRSRTSTRGGARRTSRSPSTSGSRRSSPTTPATSSRSASSTSRRATRPRANATWKRIIASNKPAAYAKLGEVLAEHGQAYYSEAETSFNEAIKLDAEEPRVLQGPRGAARGEEGVRRRRSPTGSRS